MAYDPNRPGTRRPSSGAMPPRPASQPSRRAPAAGRGSPGFGAILAGAMRWVGQSPTRTLLVVALGGSFLFLVYGLIARDATQIPMLCAGSAVLGLVFAGLAIGGAITSIRAARDGHAARAFASALGGGIAAIASAIAFAVALVLAMVWGAA